MDGEPDPTELFERIPFAEDLGIELTRAADGHAEGRLELAERHTSNERTGVVHGGVTYSLADTVGGAAAYSAVGRSTPTVATVDVTVTDGSGAPVAECRGVYKTGGGDGGGAWGDRPGGSR
ncbi:thioesterase [Halobacteriales archaeon QS_5_70_15]|nr:MAG: thioesterase [Halobacteriales archaeon QS_5_70_15]